MKPICCNPDHSTRCPFDQDIEPLDRTWLGGQCRRRRRTVRAEHRSPAPSDWSRTHRRGFPTPQRRAPRRPGKQQHNKRPSPALATTAGPTYGPARLPPPLPAVEMDDRTRDLRAHCRRPRRPLYHWRSRRMLAFQKEDLLQFGAYHPLMQDLAILLRRSLFLHRLIFLVSMHRLVDDSQRQATEPMSARPHVSPLHLILATQNQHPRRRALPHPRVVSAAPSLGAAISWQS